MNSKTTLDKKMYQYANSSIESDLKLLEKNNYEIYGAGPLDFYTASEVALNNVKKHLPSLLREHKIQAVQSAKGRNQIFFNNYEEKIESCNFKTTLGMEVSNLPKDLESHTKDLERVLDSLIGHLILKVSESFDLQIRDTSKAWERYLDQVYAKKAESLVTRFKYTIAFGLVLSSCFSGVLFFYTSQMFTENFFIAFNLFNIFLIFSKKFNKFLVKLFSKNYSLSNFLNFRSYLNNSDEINTADVRERINSLHQVSMQSVFHAAHISRRATENPLISLAVVGFGFLFNELSGPSLAKTKNILKQQILEHHTIIVNTYEKTFENLEQPIIESLELMVRSLQVQYKNALRSIFDQGRDAFQENKKSEDANGLKTNITTKENQARDHETSDSEKPKKVA